MSYTVPAQKREKEAGDMKGAISSSYNLLQGWQDEPYDEARGGQKQPEH